MYSISFLQSHSFSLYKFSEIFVLLFFSVHRYYTIKYVLLLFVIVVVCTVTFEKPLINDNVDDYEKIQNNVWKS